MTQRPSPALAGWVCEHGHAFVHRHARCTICGRRMRRTRISPAARLLVVTTVHAAPGGAFDLGVAVTRSGARTLCRVEGAVRRTGHDAVVLERRGHEIVARPRRGRPR